MYVTSVTIILGRGNTQVQPVDRVDTRVRYSLRVWLCSPQSQQSSVVHPESSHKMVSAPVTGVQLFGHGWYEQNASQHCDTSHGSSSHSTSLALSIGV